jgi:response regulator RpfG family c-di-GMP phosphodiesterase
LEQARSLASACRLAVSPEQAAVAAPLGDDNGVQSVAVAYVDGNCGLYAERLADAAVREVQHSEELEWLRDENYVFSQQVTDDFEELTFLRRMATHLIVTDTTLDVNHIVDQTIAGLREMIGAEAIYFVKLTEDGRHEVVRNCCSSPDLAQCVDSSIVAGLSIKHRERATAGPFVRNDLDTSDPEAFEAGVRQYLQVPISTGARHFGWFVAVNRALVGRHWKPSPLLQLGHDEFGTWEASLLSTAATLVASHSSNLDLIREKEQLLINTVRSLVSALDSKDAYTRGHSERVALFSKRIAEKFGYDSVATERLYLAGLLHDVGKIGVSDAILRKPDKLTPEEFAEIKRHPDEGYAILRDLEQLRYVLPAVLHHHEQVDGAGYPDGLKNEQIPLDARIMAVADAYDAMTSDRAYRAGMPHEKAVAILRSGAGTQWDAKVVEAFLSVIHDITTIRYGYTPYARNGRSEPALAPNCKS